MLLLMVIVTVVVKCDAVELLKRIRNLAHGRGETRVERDALDLGGSDIYALALLDIAEVGCLNTSTLVRNNRWLHMTQKRPLCGAEEGRSLDV